MTDKKETNQDLVCQNLSVFRVCLKSIKTALKSFKMTENERKLIYNYFLNEILDIIEKELNN